MDFCRILLLVSSACVLCVGASSSWGYFGDDDETHWSSNDAICAGNKQSPINIESNKASYKSYSSFVLTGFDTTTGLTIQIENNGHTAKLTPFGVAPRVSGGGLTEQYTAGQIHFHWGETNDLGSEHQVDGNKFPMEMHVVTYKTSNGGIGDSLDDATGLAVLGFLIEVGSEDHPTFQKILDAIDQINAAGSTYNLTVAFKLEDLMPAEFPNFYRYSGSLTTPPCSEAVVWTVFTDTVKISSTQLAQFRTLLMNEQNDAGSNLMYNNYRTPQALNGRTVWSNFDSSSSYRPSITLSLLALPCLRMLL